MGVSLPFTAGLTPIVWALGLPGEGTGELNKERDARSTTLHHSFFSFRSLPFLITLDDIENRGQNSQPLILSPFISPVGQKAKLPFEKGHYKYIMELFYMY